VRDLGGDVGVVDGGVDVWEEEGCRKELCRWCGRYHEITRDGRMGNKAAAPVV
jgi:hypothetical protein